jgi:hypothetical protein
VNGELVGGLDAMKELKEKWRDISPTDALK